MIINNLKNLLEERNMTAYALSKRAGITPGNVKEIADNELVIPRAKAIQGICKSLNINIDDLLKIRTKASRYKVKQSNAKVKVNSELHFQ